jgi:hypothetical protein
LVVVGWTKWEATKTADELEASRNREKANCEVWLLALVFPPKGDKTSLALAKMESLYDTELRDIYEDLDKDGIHFPPSSKSVLNQEFQSTLPEDATDQHASRFD